MRILFTGWKDGMQKVAFTKLQVEYLNMSFKDAKLNVDNLLDGGCVIVEIPYKHDIERFIQLSQEMGVIVDTSGGNTPDTSNQEGNGSDMLNSDK